MKNNNGLRQQMPPHDMLQHIREEKEKTRRSIRNCNQRLRSMTEAIFAPPAATGRTGSIAYWFNQGLAIYKGIVMGMTVVRSARRLFRK